MSRKALTFTVTIPMPAIGDLVPLVRALPTRIWRALLVYQERASSRAALRTMDDRLRRDMGICYEDALREAYKPFWRP
ncbi:DUF1127 domain-containing protein [Rhodovibrio salinarum]|nr:DUF1127 domain-containing protein [Rhodovibrio salinarum]